MAHGGASLLGDSGDPNASQVGSRKGSTSMTIDSAESQSQTISQMDLSPKRKIDKNTPKRPHSAYLFFAKENRQKVMMDNPEMKVPEINSILGARWRMLRDNKRAKFDALAAKDMERYHAEMILIPWS